MWVSGLFSKKINQTRAGGAGHPPPSFLPEGNLKTLARTAGCTPRARAAEAAETYFWVTGIWAAHPVPHHSSPMCEQVAPAAAGERDWGGGRAVSQGGRESRGAAKWLRNA